MSALNDLLDKLRTREARFKSVGGHLLYWTLLLLATWAVVSPLWIGPIPPLTDFGGHAAIADVWARLEEVELYQQLFERRTGLVPNTLPSRFAGLLYPLLEPLTALRLFTSLALFATIGAVVGMARAFGRSRWLVFLCVPFLWNTGLYWGMINYVAVIPLFFAALALARKAGQTGDWRWGLGLALACLLSFFAHGLGCVFTIGAASFVLFASLRRARYALQGLAMVPGTAAWFAWKSAAEGREGMPEGSTLEFLEKSARWDEPMLKVERFFDHVLNATTSDVELALFFVLAGVWVLWMGLSSDAHPADAAADAAAEDTPQADGWAARLRRWAERVYADISHHTLLLVVLCLGAAIVLLPSHIEQTNVATRVAPLFAICAALLPRLPRFNWMALVGLVVAIGACFWFGEFLELEVREFAREELEPIDKLAEQIPAQSRVECTGLRGYNATSIEGSALNHNCTGLVQVRTQSFGGFGFPATGFNAIKFREGVDYPRLKNPRDLARLQQWDYVITDGTGGTPPEDLTELVATERADKRGAPTWSLYRVRTFDRDAKLSDKEGGPGGDSFKWYCPPGQVLTHLRGRLSGNKKHVSELTPRCEPVEVTPRKLQARGAGKTGPPLAHRARSGRRFNLRCPGDQFVVGLAGKGETFVNDLALLCADMRRKPGDEPVYRPGPTKRRGVTGKRDGEEFELRCEEDSVVQGLHGRSGGLVDAIGIACVAIEDILAQREEVAADEKSDDKKVDDKKAGDKKSEDQKAGDDRGVAPKIEPMQVPEIRQLQKPPSR